MTKIIDLLMQHQVLATFIANTILTAFISSFDAPTKDSGPFYVWCFKFMNTLAGNFKRAQSTNIEQSPNFLDAVEKLKIQSPVPQEKP